MDISEEKELFLRGKMAELFLFAIKSTVTISSACIALTVTFISNIALNQSSGISSINFGGIITGCLYFSLSFVFSVIAVLIGIKLQYLFFDNLIKDKPEFDKKTRFFESVLQLSVMVSFSLAMIGIYYVFMFIFKEFLLH